MARKKKIESIKLLISGSRSLNDIKLIDKAIAYANIDISIISEIVHGGAKGIDYCAGVWAKTHNIPVKIFKADWNNITTPKAVVKINGYGKYNARAGVDRNEQMGQYADELLAIWDGKSAGTEHLIEYMKKIGKKFCVYEM